MFLTGYMMQKLNLNMELFQKDIMIMFLQFPMNDNLSCIYRTIIK